MKAIFAKPLWKTAGIFVSMWLVYYILELISGNIQGIYAAAMNLIIPALFLALMAGIFYTMSIKSSPGLKSNKIFLIILVLIIIEQGLKLLIRITGNMEASYELIHNWLYFNPVLNTLGSWGASRFGLTLGITAFLIINIIAIPLVLQIYRFYIKENTPSFWVSNAFILCFSGIICSMIDKMFFGGSLDFIMLKNLFVADIKDFYITLSIGCLLVELLLQNMPDSKSSIKDDLDLLKRFLAFNLNDIKRIKKF